MSSSKRRSLFEDHDKDVLYFKALREGPELVKNIRKLHK